jgi:hypothetical protein
MERNSKQLHRPACFSEAKAVLESCAALAEAMPDNFSVQVGIAAAPDGAPTVLVVPTWCGPPEEGEQRLAPFLSLGTLLAGAIEKKSYGALLLTFDQQISNGLRVFAETCWLPAFDACAINAFIAVMRCAVSPGCAILTPDFKGAASRVAANAAAFGLRRDHVVVEVLAMAPAESDELDARRHRAWARNAREAYTGALPGGYPNFLGSDEAERAVKSYGGNAERLIRAKHSLRSRLCFFFRDPIAGRASHFKRRGRARSGAD